MSNGAKWYCPSIFAGHTPYLPDEIPNSGYVPLEDGEYKSSPLIVDVECEPAGDMQNATLELQHLLNETKTEPSVICTYYRCSSLDDLTLPQIREASKSLKVKLEALSLT
jgi:hypothetical protein